MARSGQRDRGRRGLLRLRRAEQLDADHGRDAAGRSQGRVVPDCFKALNNHGLPAFGIIASTLLASLAMIVNYLGSSGATVCTTLVLMTGITSAVPYLFSALAQM